MEIAVAVLVATIINAIILIVLQKRHDPELYRPVAFAYVGTVSLRYILAVYLWMNHGDPGFSRMFWGDSQTYDSIGAAIAEGWSQNLSLESWTTTMEGKTNKGFIYFVASIYYLFGRNVLLVQFINGIIGSLTAICVLEMGLIIYNKEVAVRAMIFTAFFPQMIFWSSGLYKDPSVMLCIAVHLLATLQLRKTFTNYSLFLYLGSAIGLLFLRFYIFYAVVAASLLGFVFGQFRQHIMGLLTHLTLIAGIVVLLLFTPLGKEALQQQRYFSLSQLQVSRSDLADHRSGYLANADVSTPAGALQVLPTGVVYLLFSPFPWAARSIRQLLAIPDVLVWYLMVPALIRGLFSAVRYRLSKTMPILIFTTSLTLAYGVFQSNAGAAYRQRTQIMMFFFLFVADGMKKTRSKEQPDRENILSLERKGLAV